MRRDFHPILLRHMREDPRIVVLVGDLGYKMFDSIAAEFPNRFWNVGAAEQLLLAAGIGLAEEGKIPVLYSITPFLLKRPIELIDLYVNHESVPVKLLGGGRGKDYHEDGPSHDATGDDTLLNLWPNIHGYWPTTVAELPDVVDTWLNDPAPAYLNLKR